MPKTLPENLKLVYAYMGAADALGTSADVVSLENYHRLWIIAIHKGTSDTDLVLNVQECDDTTPTTAADMSDTFPIWENTNYSSSDTLTRITDAASYTIDPAAAGSTMVVIEVDPSKLTAGYPCVRVKGTGGHSENTVAVLYALDPRYPGDPLPAATS